MPGIKKTRGRWRFDFVSLDEVLVIVRLIIPPQTIPHPFEGETGEAKIIHFENMVG
jgi:hypothetical protein